MTATCEHKSCQKTFKTPSALERHYDAVHSTESLAAKEITIRPNRSVKRKVFKSCDPDSARKKQAVNDPRSTPLYSLSPPEKSNQEESQSSRLFKIPLVPVEEDSVIKNSKEDGKTTRKEAELPKYPGSLNALEQMLAEFAFDTELSNSEYESFVKIVQAGMSMTHTAKKTIEIKTTTLDKLKSTLKKDADPCSLVEFITCPIDVHAIDDFPKGHEKEFTEGIVEPLELVYRDMHDLCEHLFSHPSFSEVMNIYPSIYRRDDDVNGPRVYGDIDSGNWWQSLQAELSDEYVLLPIMLASDQTTVSGNFRTKAWPVYMKLGNIPVEARDQPCYRASRLLAYFPTIDWKATTNVPSWFTTAKYAVIHYCLSKILGRFCNTADKVQAFRMNGPGNKQYKCIPALACYIADLPEQRMLALVKGGSSNFSCPRCKVGTCSFHCQYEFSFDQGKSVGRTKKYMKKLYEKGKSLGKSESLKHGQRHSYHLVENAFWKAPLFDIYQALTVDDLHQIGGMYSNLLSLIENILKDRGANDVIKQITKRASILPLFRKLRPFTSGFFPSALKNPTYTELRSHMAIFMACTHDLLPPQIVRCMRHFIDFVQQALAKEHTEETLADMQESLRLYNKYSAVFSSTNKMIFPKNHALWKYMFDIRQKGCINGYSTLHSESQHKFDAKQPAKRTNFVNSTFAIQMANYVMYRDLLFDTYQAASSEEIKSKMKGKISNCGNMNTPDTAQDPDLVPSSPLMSNNPTNFDELSEKHPSLKELYNLTRIYLSTLKDGEKPVKLKNMPKPKNNKIYAYQTLKINDTDDRGTSYTEFIRANPSFHRRARYDFVQTKDGYFVQVLLFFNIERTFTMESDDPFCDVVEERLCLVRVFTYIEEVHASGLQVVKYPNDSDIRQQGLCVMSIKNIERLVHVVPDFSTALNQIEEEDGIYDCYLVNHDIDPNHWSYGATKNFIDIPDQELVKWS